MKLCGCEWMGWRYVTGCVCEPCVMFGAREFYIQRKETRREVFKGDEIVGIGQNHSILRHAIPQHTKYTYIKSNIKNTLKSLLLAPIQIRLEISFIMKNYFQSQQKMYERIETKINSAYIACESANTFARSLYEHKVIQSNMWGVASVLPQNSPTDNRQHICIVLHKISCCEMRRYNFIHANRFCEKC